MRKTQPKSTVAKLVAKSKQLFRTEGDRQAPHTPGTSESESEKLIMLFEERHKEHTIRLL